MKQLITTFVLIIACVFGLQAQDFPLEGGFGEETQVAIQEGPITVADGKGEFSFSLSDKVSSKGQEITAIIAVEMLNKKAYTYAANKGDDAVRSIFKFSGEGFELVGDVVEPKFKVYKDVLDFVYYKHVHDFEFTQKIKVTNPQKFKLILNLSGQFCDDTACVPYRLKTEFKADIVEASVVKALADNPVEPVKEEKSFFGLFLAGIVGGLFALITPCVFPMVPITISYFLKQSDGNHRKTVLLATVYGVGIVVIFTAMGLSLTYFMQDVGGVNWLATNPIVNIFIGVVFVFFALSFLGLFNLAPPAWLQNKAFSAGQTGGYVGALLMGFAFAVTSFTCTAPIVGAQLSVASSTGNYMGPAISMIGFSGIIAFVFFVIAMFPGMLKSMPKSGGWLTEVKFVLGLLELALAFKFFRVADLEYNLGILSHDMVLLLWVITSAVIALYVLGAFKFLKKQKFSFSLMRSLFSLSFIALSVYMFFGLIAKVKLDANIESFLLEDNASYKGFVWNKKAEHVSILNWIDDYDKALDIAQKEKKNIFIDFSGRY
jgi:thiol:disulfide interchange protein